MKSWSKTLPPFVTVIVCCAMLIHGPIAQLAHYNEFADQSTLLGIARGGDVLSNVGFALIALWGIVRLWPLRYHPALLAGRYGYSLFLLGLLLTAFGSGYYHLAPDNARLVWDRLPIALACAGLLAAVRAENLPNENGKTGATLLAVLAIISVDWWRVTDLYGGIGDLRPYLLFQVLPLLLIPLWQAIYRAPPADRLAFGVALLAYVAAKLAEINDQQIFAALGVISGHTLKHLLATVAAWILVARLVQRTKVPLVSTLRARTPEESRARVSKCL